ncbi:hypothetical protein BDN72DRAFT_650196 [Pluteus cervinus]|uniref:Uncharacterized protein n=1 Tax=Pluteus cervinus TaxID=181527 RepID=A0ACD3A006_9AGAR|nr:hypothetical protein BDN72DRAFT_650196 [Pluteus cervinus]
MIKSISEITDAIRQVWKYPAISNIMDKHHISSIHLKSSALASTHRMRQTCCALDSRVLGTQRHTPPGEFYQLRFLAQTFMIEQNARVADSIRVGGRFALVHQGVDNIIFEQSHVFENKLPMAPLERLTGGTDFDQTAKYT